jgi:hypothetical protein
MKPATGQCKTTDNIFVSFFLPPLLSAIFKPTRRKPGYSLESRPGKTGFRFRNKGCAIGMIWDRGLALLSVFLIEMCLRLSCTYPSK